MKSFLVITWFLFLVVKLSGQSLSLQDSNQYQSLSSDSLFELSLKGYRDLANPPEIRLEYATLGLDRAIEDQNPGEASVFFSRLAVIYTELGLNQQALENGLQALDFAQKSTGQSDEIWALIRLSETRFVLRDTSRALEDAYHALQISLQRDTLEEIGWSYNCLGEIYRRIPRYDSALHYYQLGLQTFQTSGHQKGVHFSHQNLGLTYSAMGDYDRAVDEFSRSDPQEQDLLFQLEHGQAMLKIISARHSLDSAIAYGTEMLALAEQEKYPTWQQKFKAELAGLYRMNSDWETAWQYHLEADSMEEIQIGERIRLQTRVTDHQYQMQLLLAEQALEAQRNQNQILLWISVILVGGLLSSLGIIQIAKNKRIRIINQQLSRKNDHLDEMIQEKDIWINLMAHDLKAPLSSISGLLEILKEENLPQPIMEKVLYNISKSVEKGSELITQLLEISRLETGQIKVNNKPTDLRALVEEMGEMFKPSADKKNIGLQVEIPTKAEIVETDPVIVQRILENLVSNAIKFSPAEKDVRIVMDANPENVKVHVIDQGPGLSEEDQRNLFQKFKKLSAQPTGGESSTGLGLSIVRLLAERVNAQILVESQLGEGATFSVSLPN